MSERIHPVILAGGSGTRLWPLSRALYPKQFLSVAQGESLIAGTFERVGDGARFAPAVVVCNNELRFLVAEQVRRLGTGGHRIVVEPDGRNTAPAVCLAALLLAEEDPAAVMLVLPSDHVIKDVARFTGQVTAAAAAAREGRLVTFGARAERPETGYGYIRKGEALAGLDGCFACARFVEKPDAGTAEGYVRSGAYAWNTGMFVFRADAILEALEAYEPDIVAACRAALGEGAERDLDFLRPAPRAFSTSPSVSIDVAVMERSPKAAVVSGDFGWSDVGSWQSLYDIAEKDEAENASAGDVLAIESRGNLLHSESHLLAALGIENMVVVVTKDAVLVAPRDRAQEIKQVVGRLQADSRAEHLTHRKVYRPWGSYEGLATGPGFQVKHLVINPGARISLQRHRHRAEHWVVTNGVAEVTRDNETFTLAVNESTYIPIGAVHRLANPHEDALNIIEVQCGDYLGEDDIERFEDIYGRA